MECIATNFLYRRCSGEPSVLDSLVVVQIEHGGGILELVRHEPPRTTVPCPLQENV